MTIAGAADLGHDLAEADQRDEADGGADDDDDRAQPGADAREGDGQGQDPRADRLGPGRIFVALHHHSSNYYQIHEESRSLYF